MLHAIEFDIELGNIEKTDKLLDKLWNKYMIRCGANYNQDWRIVLQKFSDLIGAIKCESKEYESYEGSICKRKCNKI